MGRLKGKIAVITGAASGMGASHARLFCEEGARVVVSDLDEELGKAVSAECCGDAIFFRHDVTDPASWEELLAVCEEEFGPVNVLVNNAGIAGPSACTVDLSVRDYLAVMNVDANGVYLGMRAVVPAMLRAGGGSIVNISSISGFVHAHGTPNAAYTAAKFAVRGLTKATALEYARQNVRVNSVHPGAVLTPMMDAAISAEQRRAIAEAIPMGRIADPREISAMVVFLASDEASYITGSEFVVDGGVLAA